jgi:hypothetical protein
VGDLLNLHLLKISRKDDNFGMDRLYQSILQRTGRRVCTRGFCHSGGDGFLILVTSKKIVLIVQLEMMCEKVNLLARGLHTKERCKKKGGQLCKGDRAFGQ